MHILKKRLNEIEQMENKPEGYTTMPDEIWGGGTTFEEKILYMYYCYYKCLGYKELPDLKELSRITQFNEKLVFITMEALREKGITY